MSKNFTRTYLYLILFAFTINLNAATIKGRVIDSNTHESIIGATILVENQKYFAVSDAQGNYILTDLPVGKYVIHAKSMAYEDFYAQEIAIIDNNDNTTFDIYLKPNNVTLSEVEVTEKSKATDASARNSEKNADNIINVVSAKTIELSPDLTVANVIQRMSGVTLERNATGDGQYALLRGMDKRFNYTMVNGVKIPSPDNKNRFVPLDIFPSELLDRLEVTKSLTANMEGDGIGGAINMVMKDAPATMQLTANLGTGYNSIYFNNDYQFFDVSAINAKSPSERYGLAYPVKIKDFTTENLHLNTGKAKPNLTGGFSYGNRFISDKLGFMLAGSYQKNERANTSDVYGTSMNADGQQNITHRFYSNQQARLGLHAKFDVKLAANHKIMWYNAYMDFQNTQVREAISSDSRTTRLRWNRQRIMNSTLKGIHSFANSRLNLDWTLSYGKALSETPDNVLINELIINGITGIKQSEGASRRWEHNSDKDLTGNFDLRYRIKFGDLATLDLSTGGMYHDKVRGSYFNEYVLTPKDESKPLGLQAQEIRGVDYANFDEVKFYAGSFGNLSDPLNYDATEKIGALYLVEKLSIKKLQFIAGVRAEHTNQGYNLKFVTENARNEGSQEYVDILPSFGFKYPVHKNANLRLSYVKAINRPSFFEIVPYNIITEEYNERGNPDLKHTTADNFDLRYEYFPYALDQLMVGFFYKNIKDPIEFGFKSFGQDQALMPMNFGNANNYGAEVDIIKYFGWFGFRANYTFTNSNITTSKRKDIPNPDPNAETKILTINVDQTRPLYGQAEHVANFSILFKDMHHGWDGQLAIAYTGDRLCIVSPLLDQDSWQAGFTSLDASVEKKFKSGLSLFTKASNLLNSLMTQYVKRNDENSKLTNVERYHKGIVEREEYYGINLSIGLKYKFQ